MHLGERLIAWSLKARQAELDGFPVRAHLLRRLVALAGKDMAERRQRVQAMMDEADKADDAGKH